MLAEGHWGQEGFGQDAPSGGQQLTKLSPLPVHGFPSLPASMTLACWPQAGQFLPQRLGGAKPKPLPCYALRPIL